LRLPMRKIETRDIASGLETRELKVPEIVADRDHLDAVAARHDDGGAGKRQPTGRADRAGDRALTVRRVRRPGARHLGPRAEGPMSTCRQEHEQADDTHVSILSLTARSERAPRRRR